MMCSMLNGEQTNVSIVIIQTNDLSLSVEFLDVFRWFSNNLSIIII